MKDSATNRLKSIDTVFHPKSIAVIGASDHPGSFGYHYLHFLKEAGYNGPLYAVNPRYKKILDFETYPDMLSIPDDVDYVICCLNAELVVDLLEQCPPKNVKAVQMFTGRLSETGNPEACREERRILAKARETGIRLVGPNCMGVYHPKQKVSFGYDLSLKPGSVGVVAQSGGIAGETARLGALRGIRFSKVVSYGNGIDLDESDFIEYLGQDPETKLILIYVEGVRNGQKFITTLRNASRIKPVIVLKGGRGQAGSKAASSHTAAMAGSFNTWETVLKQCNVAEASGLDEMLNLTVAFSMLPRIRGKKAVIVGGGGGKGVLSADEAEEEGLSIGPLPEQISKMIEKKSTLLSGWIGNPVDFSVLSGDKTLPLSTIMQALSENQDIDLIIANLTEDNPFSKQQWIELVEKEIEELIRIGKSGSKPIMAVMNNPHLNLDNFSNWRWQNLAAQRQRLKEAGIPVFSSIRNAARSVSAVQIYCSNNGHP